MYNPAIHHRRSIRLKGYDYSMQGLFFVTICVENRKCLFGEIISNHMLLNEAGTMIEKWYHALEQKFPTIKCHEHIVMPNHFHCIIENTGAAGANPCVRPIAVGADQCVRPNGAVGANPCVPPNEKSVGANPCVHPNEAAVGANPCVRPNDEAAGANPCVRPNEEQIRGVPQIQTGGHIGPPQQSSQHSPQQLGGIIQWFKTMSTNEYIRKVKSAKWPQFSGRLWQRNYWEHIIRSEKSFNRIAEYINDNPSNWQTDIINPGNDIK